MNLPKYLFACTLFFALCTDLTAQREPDCALIQVETKVEDSMPGLPNSGKIILKFQSADYKEFNLFLFGEKKAYNRLNVVAEEIKELPRGNYTLIIQGKDQEKYCTKQLKLRIN